MEVIRAFYVEKLSYGVDRSPERSIDFDFYRREVSANLVEVALTPAETNLVDGVKVPLSYFGAFLGWDDWQAMTGRLEADGTDFTTTPKIRLTKEVGEQAIMFFPNP